MAGVNKAIIVGRLGKDPEVRHLESGATVSTFSIATSESYKDRNTGEKKEVTDWHNIVLWRGLAEIAEKYLKKGDQVYIEGKLKTRSWEKEGVTRYTTEIVGDNMTMLGSGQSGGSQSAPIPTSEYDESTTKAPTVNEPIDSPTDDLPF